MEAAIAGIRRAIAAIDDVLKEENYIRPSRQRPTPLPITGSCATCKKNKAKCDGDGERGAACSRCISAGNPEGCVYPLQARPGRKQGVNKRSILLTETRRELVQVLHLLEPDSTPVAPAEAPSISQQLPPPPIPPLIKAAPASPPPLHIAQPLSPSVLSLGDPPGDPSLLSAFNLPTVPSLPKVASSPTFISGYEAPSPGNVLQNDALNGIDNPLEVLAHVSLHDREEATSDSFSFAMQEESELINKAERYYATGLYTALDDTDGGEDPVSRGLLTEKDLRRLISLYFTKLRPFFFHFSPDLHTSDFFRNVSPFLCTSFAYICATYCSQSSHLVEPLRQHVARLSNRVLAGGFKSPELVQAYLLLSHWAPAAESWCEDRSWAWLGEALRIATEIRMDRPMTEERINDYRARTPLSARMIDLLQECTDRSWHLLWSANLMMSVHSGRIVGKSFIGALRSSFPAVEKSHPNYMYHANEVLNRVFANGLNLASRLADKPLTNSYDLFNRSWRSELEAWVRDYSGINQFLWIRYWNVRIMLLTLSLKFGPPTKPVLEEVSGAALATLGKVLEWAAEGESIVYSANSAITNIAYGATILLKFISASDPGRDPNLKTVVLDLCSKVVETLFRIGNGRANAPSMATLQAARMQSLLRTINPIPTPAPMQMPAHLPLPLELPFAFPSPSATSANLGFDGFNFGADDYQAFNTSTFFEDFSSSNLLSLMGQQVPADQAMNWGGWDASAGDPWPLGGGIDFGRSG